MTQNAGPTPIARRSVVFKAALWKELRQASGWLGIGLSGTALALAFVLTTYADTPNLLLSYTFAVTAVVSPLVGLVIGVAQTIFESRGDRWAFLTHRPVSRSTLFFTKVAAGLILYTVAVGLPSACALIWMSVPGNVPMWFDWRMALPIAADLICGIAYYFAGQFIGMRGARWRVSCVASVLGIPLLLSLIAQLTPDFWQAILWASVGNLIIGAAALGAFNAGGRFELQPRVMRLATGVTVGTGLACAGLIVFVIIGFLSMMSDLRARETLRALRQSQSYTQYLVTGNGSIVQIVRGAESVFEVRDLEGRALPLTSREQPGVSGHLVDLRTDNWIVNYRSTDRFFIALRAFRDLGSVSWYYVVGQGLIAAYDKRSARPTEWLGPDGLFSGEIPTERFGEGASLRDAHSRQHAAQFLSVKNAVYLLDLDQWQLSRVFASSSGETVINVSAISYPYAETPEVAIATTERVLVQGLDGKPRLSVAHPHQVEKYARAVALRAGMNPGKPRFIFYYPEPERRPLTVEVTKYDVDGAVRDRHTLPSPVGFREASWVRTLSPWFVTPLTVPLTFGWVQGANWQNPFDATLSTSSSLSTDATQFHYYTTYEALTPPQSAVAWALCGLASVLPALLAYRWGRAFAFARGRLWLWTALSFLLGPLALALMASLVKFPGRETCPSCRRLRVVAREHCEHCGEPFSPPAFDGTEIFLPG